MVAFLIEEKKKLKLTKKCKNFCKKLKIHDKVGGRTYSSIGRNLRNVRAKIYDLISIMKNSTTKKPPLKQLAFCVREK